MSQRRARKSGSRSQGADKSFFSNDDARLRPTEKFIAAETNQIGAGPERFGWSRFVLSKTELLGIDDRAASQIFDKWDTFLSRERGDFRGARDSTKPLMKKLER